MNLIESRGASNPANLMLRCLLPIALLLCAIAAAAQPAPFILDTQAVELSGRELQVDVYEPQAAPSRGLAIVAHGFMRSRSRHRAEG